MEKAAPRRLGLGWHWLWFIPFCMMALLLVESHTVSYALRIIMLGWQRWSFAALFSPSAAFCLTMIVASIVWPLLGLWFVALRVATRQSWLYSVLLIMGIFVLPLVTDALIWGSFPFSSDINGVGHLRMIPFFPWPSSPLNEY
jgi:hypothetical protein